ncbi:phage tail tape measure protein [Stenotrophomonas sp.]|uniref:phage tail tape measure protein n=1 Tax=Stenotrophomonas sp. TaxID=69392 RepID=UPI0028B07960|nr:phage tail tape measure protein [Stenotrophomonas sp.]
MTDTAIGTARIEIEVDTSQFDSAITAAKRSVADMSSSAQQQYQQLSAAEKRRIDTLVKQADIVGMNKAQQIAYSASLRTSGPLLDEITKKLAKNQAAAQGATTEINKYGVSLKQQQAAMRGVPAQMTDILVSLQGGQHPLTVLLQQGGQLKDMFGGIVPAAQALGTQLAAMISPATIVAGALAAVAYAGYSATEQQAAFERVLITTGSYAGVAADDYQELVARLDAVAGVSRSGASDALMKVAASGKFAGEQFDLVSRAAARMSVTTGQEVEKTISKFEAIAKSPVDALLELTSTEHFLTQAQLERVVALEDEGRTQEAVAEAVRIYGTHLDEVAEKADETLSVLSRWWREVKDDTSAAWGEVGVYMQLLDQLIEKQKLSKSLWAGGEVSASGALRRAGFAQGNAASLIPEGWLSSGATLANALGKQWLRGKVAEGDLQQFPVNSTWENAVDPIGAKDAIEKAREERKKTEAEWDKWQGQNLSKKEKQQAEEKRIQAAGDALGKKQSEIDAQIAASRQRFAESEKRSSGSKAADPTIALAQRIKQQIALNTEQLQSEAKLTTSQRLRIQVEQELLSLGSKASPERRAVLNAMLKELVASGELATAHEREIKAKEQLSRLNAQIAVSEENRLRANTLDLMGYGRGGDAVDMLRRQLDIQREYEDGLKRIRDSGVAADSESWRQQETTLRASRDRMLEVERDYQSQRLALMADWRVGANAALEDYLFSAADVASQSRDMFANAFGGAEDAIRQFTKTGKFEFSDLADSIISDLTRIAAKQMITGLFGNMMSGWLGGGVTATGNALVSGGTQSINAGLTERLLSFGGGRASGGRVDARSFYEVGESGRPELFEQNGRTYLIPGNAGQVFPAVAPNSRPLAGGQTAVTGAQQIKIEVENRGQPVQAQATAQRQPDGSTLIKMLIDGVADDMASGGKTLAAIKSRLDVQERV